MTVNTDPLCPQQHTHPKHNPNRCIFCEYGASVRADALDAAREAVAAVGVRKDTSHDMRVQALAAIDGLRANNP